MKYDIFISSKSEDYPIANLVYDYLKSKGCNPFLACVELKEVGDSDYSEIIDSIIDKCEHMVVVASKLEYLYQSTSSYVFHEWSSFRHEKISGRKNGNLIPIYTREIQSKKEIPLYLRQQQSFTIENFKGNIDKYLDVPENLTQEIETLISEIEESANEKNDIGGVELKNEFDYDTYGISFFSMSRDGETVIGYYRGEALMIQNFNKSFYDIKRLGQKMDFPKYISILQKKMKDFKNKQFIHVASFLTVKNYGMLRKYIKKNQAIVLKRMTHELCLIAFGMPETQGVQKVELKDKYYCYYEQCGGICNIKGIGRCGEEYAMEISTWIDDSKGIPDPLLSALKKIIEDNKGNYAGMLFDVFPFNLGIMFLPKDNEPMIFMEKTNVLPIWNRIKLTAPEYDKVVLRIIEPGNELNKERAIQYNVNCESSFFEEPNFVVSAKIDNKMEIECNVGGVKLYI